MVASRSDTARALSGIRKLLRGIQLRLATRLSSCTAGVVATDRRLQPQPSPLLLAPYDLPLYRTLLSSEAAPAWIKESPSTRYRCAASFIFAPPMFRSVDTPMHENSCTIQSKRQNFKGGTIPTQVEAMRLVFNTCKE